MGKCIILNGTSSSGKTTVSKELQKLLPELAHVEIGNMAHLYFEMFREDYNHTAEWGEKRYNRQIVIREILLNSANLLLKQGFDVCIDTVLDGPMQMNIWSVI
ncbi:MAG: AAA family ATPase [Sphingobacteriia bacterium]|nr:AAA family ATPase [Sphingobacteriia bacterium]